MITTQKKAMSMTAEQAIRDLVGSPLVEAGHSLRVFVRLKVLPHVLL
jgi:hypothetical protein